MMTGVCVLATVALSVWQHSGGQGLSQEDITSPLLSPISLNAHDSPTGPDLRRDNKGGWALDNKGDGVFVTIEHETLFLP